METREFSDEFDVLLKDLGIALNEYEKSVYLTLAQDEIVRSLYNGTLKNESLEGSEELRRDLDSLIKTATPEKLPNSSYMGVSSDSVFYELGRDVLYITYESATLSGTFYCENDPTVSVIPAKQDEWHRIKNNPFRGPNKNRVMRLDYGNNIVELVSKYPIKSYLIRYVSKPSPIILTTLEDGLYIDGEFEEMTCKLNPALHRTILNGAVQLVKSKYTKSK